MFKFQTMETQMNKMNQKIIFLLGIPFLMLASCAQTSVSDAQAAYCQELANLELAIVNFQGLSADSTVKDLKQAQEQVRSAFTAVKQAASNLEDAKVEQLEQSQQNLEKAVNDVPDDSTLATALKSVSDQVGSVSKARQELFSSANCPAQ